MPIKRSRPLRNYEHLLATIPLIHSDQCYMWIRGINSKGYPVVYTKEGMKLVHRVAFFIAHGHWPKGRHTCDQPLCFNPAHIVEGSHAQNMRDMAIRSRASRGGTPTNRKINGIAGS